MNHRQPATDDYKQLIKAKVLDDQTFFQAIFKGKPDGTTLPWRQVKIRPVLVKGRPYFQFSYLDERQDISKNFQRAQAADPLAQLLDRPFNSIQVKTATGTIRVQFSKKGKAIIHRVKPKAAQPPHLDHNRRKQRYLPDAGPDPFLETIGLMTQSGKIKAGMRSKYRQINHFLELVDHTGKLETFTHTPLEVVDFGCGSAQLTFALYHHLTHNLGLKVHLTGLDLKSSLIKKHQATAQQLGWENVNFHSGSIIDYHPQKPADIVIALHACDTASDEALAQAINMQSKLIFCAPCCHHHLQQQLKRQAAPQAFGAVLKHGILKERLGDILTDSLRAALLRMLGYQTDVIQFTASEHTAKNLMIRAVKSDRLLPLEQTCLEYQSLKSMWQVTPYLETLLEERDLLPLSLSQGLGS